MDNMDIKYINDVLTICPHIGYVLYCQKTKSYHDIVYLQDEGNVNEYIAVSNNYLNAKLMSINDQQDSLIIENAAKIAAIELVL